MSEIGGFRRECLLFPAQPSAPLVVFLTGTGGTAEWADRETGWSELAQREGFALAIPEALPPNLSKPPSFLKNPPRWSDGAPSLFTLPVHDDISFLTVIINDAIHRLNIDARRVFVTGFSNGAGMTFRVATELADRIAAIAPVAGYCWLNDPRPARPVPTLYTVGTRDLFIPLRGGDVQLPWHNRLIRRPPITETLELWANALGCDVIPALQSDDGIVRIERYLGPVVFDTVIVEGLGHHWPGGGGQLNPRVAGPPSNAVNATEMIWAFFESVSRSPSGRG